MKIPLKWLTPILLRLLPLSHVTLANAAAAALQNAGSVHLVAGFHVGLAANPQPHDLSLDSTTYLQLTNQEYALPIMPLHLLGKKSWNVYNQDNIAKVKRDETVAAAKEAAEDERMQEIDSERRIQILRGERPAPLAIEEGPPSPPAAHGPESFPPSSSGGPLGGRDRKKRKRPNEDDTDFELRIARDQARSSHLLSAAPPPPSSSSSTTITRHPTSSSNAPLTDPAGHISLFPAAAPPPGASPAAKNPEAELEAARKRREYEDQYTMRFANAAGFKQGLDAPWYSQAAAAGADGAGAGDRDGAATVVAPVGKDVWGNEDPRRRHREEARVAASDPLGAMRRGAAGARRVERERERWREERDREMVGLLRAERERKERRKRRRRDDELVDRGRGEGGLDGFSLDMHESNTSSRHRRHSEERTSGHRDSHRRSRHRHRDGDRDRSRDRESDRHRRHDRH